MLKACGIGESRVDLLIGDLMREQENPTIGLLASPEAVRIRIAARADSLEAAKALIAPVEAVVRERLAGGIMGADDDTLEGVLEELLAARGWTLAIAEVGGAAAVTGRLSGKSVVGSRVDCQNQENAASVEARAVDISGGLLVEFLANCTLVLIRDGKEKVRVYFE